MNQRIERNLYSNIELLKYYKLNQYITYGFRQYKSTADLVDGDQIRLKPRILLTNSRSQWT